MRQPYFATLVEAVFSLESQAAADSQLVRDKVDQSIGEAARNGMALLDAGEAVVEITVVTKSRKPLGQSALGTKHRGK